MGAILILVSVSAASAFTPFSLPAVGRRARSSILSAVRQPRLPSECLPAGSKVLRLPRPDRMRRIADVLRVRASPAVATCLAAAQGDGEPNEFASFTLLEVAAGNGDLTLKQSCTVARELASRATELSTLDMMAALGACFASSDVSVDGVDLADVWALIKDFKAKKAKPNTMTCTHMLGICVHFAAAGRAGHEEALEILDWTLASGLRPDHVMVAQVMDACAKAASHGGSGTLQILQKVLEYARNLDPPIRNNVVTYTSMIDALAKAVSCR